MDNRNELTKKQIERLEGQLYDLRYDVAELQRAGARRENYSAALGAIAQIERTISRLRLSLAVPV